MLASQHNEVVCALPESFFTTNERSNTLRASLRRDGDRGRVQIEEEARVPSLRLPPPAGSDEDDFLLPTLRSRGWAKKAIIPF